MGYDIHVEKLGEEGGFDWKATMPKLYGDSLTGYGNTPEIVDVIVESESNSYEDIEKNIAELQHLLKDENFQSEKSQQAIIRSIEFLNSQQKQSL